MQAKNWMTIMAGLTSKVTDLRGLLGHTFRGSED
jgi:hypothetical protein